jgi:hypothetical protein
VPDAYLNQPAHSDQGLATFVPTARLAQLLIISRSESDQTLDDLAEALEGRFSVGELKQLEAAVLPVTDDELRLIAKAYQLDFALIAPARGLLEVDLTARWIAIDDYAAEIPLSFSDQDIFVRYLALLYKFRHKTPGEDLELRDPDLAVLSEMFVSQASNIPDLLHALIRENVLRITVEFQRLQHRPSAATVFIERRVSRGTPWAVGEQRRPNAPDAGLFARGVA